MYMYSSSMYIVLLIAVNKIAVIEKTQAIPGLCNWMGSDGFMKYSVACPVHDCICS